MPGHRCELFVVEVLYSDGGWRPFEVVGSRTDAKVVIRELLREDRRLSRVDLRVVHYRVGKRPEVL